MIAEGKDTDAEGNKIEVEDSEDSEAELGVGKKIKKKTRAEIEKAARLMEDHYAILGLEETGIESTEFEVSKAYKNMALLFHPDKLAATKKITAKDKEIWLQIQEAYDTFMDPARKIKYDSALPFDDKIPKLSEITDATFFELYEPTFILNSRFSIIKPTPPLGDINTPIEEV